MRLDKYLSTFNLGSRKVIKEHVKNGTVAINGVIAQNAAFQIDPSIDIITFNGQEYFYQEYHYYMLHKPQGLISATTDANRPCVLELFKDEPVKNLFPVGRLDKDTEGLLLITDDGGFSHKITSPSHNLYKTYYAKLDGCIDHTAIDLFKEGVDIGDETKTLPAILEIEEATPTYSSVYISIREGRYHQVKRMFQSLHLPVLYLKRVSIGSLQLDSTLPIGEYRNLSKEEQIEIFK